MNYRKFNKIIASFLVASLLAPYLLHVDFSYGEIPQKESKLVVLLVEKDLFKENEANQTDTLSGKIYRYADDLRHSLSQTKVKIVRVSADKHPAQIAALLEKYYLEGENNATEINFLQGVVIIGQVSLPVVKFKNYFLPTLFPYTDFENPAFLWNAQSGQFERNSQNLAPQAEIWHGLIQAPDQSNRETALKEFFDKNHAFHSGKSEYADFDTKVFYADLIEENNSLNRTLLQNYYLRNEYSEDLAYLRYNKHFAERLSQKVARNIAPTLNIDDDGDGKIDEDPYNLKDDDGDGKVDEDPGDIFKGVDNDRDGQIDEDDWDYVDNDADGQVDEDPASSSLQQNNLFQEMPDVHTKEYIDNFLSTYPEVTENYLQSVHNFIESSGRWTIEDVDSFPDLIYKLDESFALATKDINSFFERLVDNQVETAWQEDVSLLESVTVFDSTHTANRTYLNYLNGKKASVINRVEECSLYRGTAFVEQENIGVQGEFNRLYNPNSAGDPKDACDPYGGCCANNFTTFEKCQVNRALRPVYDPLVAYEKSGDATPQACRVVNLWDGKDHLGSSNQILDYQTKHFSSVFKHIEPTNQTIKNALENNFSFSLVTDDPRSVFFQDRGEKNIQIDYFNLFRLKNTDKFKNDLPTIKTLLNTSLKEYSVYLEEKVLQQNLDIFGRYLYFALGMHTQNETFSFYDLTQFEKKYQAWQIDMLAFLQQKYSTTTGLVALNQYLKDSGADYETELAEILQHYFGDLLGQVNQTNVITSLRDFIRQGGVVFKYNHSGVTFNPQSYYSLEEVYFGLKKRVSNFGQTGTLQIDFEKNFQTVSAPPREYLLEEMRQYGEDFIALVVQWQNATLEEKHRLIFENYYHNQKTLYPFQAEKGYEAAYLKANGNTENFDLSLNDIQPVLKDPEWERILTNQFFPTNGLPEENSTQFAQLQQEALEEKCGSMTEGVDLWEWPASIQCWLNEMLKNAASLSTFADPASYAALQQNPVGEMLNAAEIEQTETAGFLEGSVASVTLSLDQNTLAQNQKTAFTLSLQDQKGQPVDSAALTLQIEGNGQILQATDFDSTKPGIQVASYQGSYQAVLQHNGGNNPLTLNVFVQDKLKASATIQIIDQLQLVLSTGEQKFQDGLLQGKIYVNVYNGKGKKINTLHPQIHLRSSDPSITFLENDGELRLENGSGELDFSIKSDQNFSLEISATAPGFSGDFLTLKPQAKVSSQYQLVFVDLPDKLSFAQKQTLGLELRDYFGNPVTVPNLQTTVRLTDATQNAAELQNFTLDFSTHARQSFEIQTLRQNTTLHLVTESNVPQVKNAALEIQVGNLISKNDLTKIVPNALYTTLAGAGFGDLVDPNNLANRLLFAGKTQAVTTLQGKFENYTPGLTVFPDGRIERYLAQYQSVLIQQNPLTIKIYNTDQQTTDLVYRLNFPSDIATGEFNLALNLDKPGLFLKNLDPTSSLQIKTKNGITELKDQEGSILELTPEGGVVLRDNRYSLAIETEENDYLTLNLLFDYEKVAQVLVNQATMEVMYQSSSATAFFAEGNTLGATGIQIFDTTQVAQPLNLEMQENLTDSANVNGIGWSGEYKNELLFAGQSSVGEATKNAASVFEILLGDPTTVLKKSASATEIGFDQTTGQQIFYNPEKSIQQVIHFNFNADIYTDLAVVYSDGYLQLLEGAPGGAFHKRGDLLYLADHIQSIQAIDQAQDQYEDLLVLTNERKVKLLVNREEHFTAQDVRLNTHSQLRTIRTEDLNKDGFIDLLTTFSNGDIGIYYGEANGFQQNVYLIGSVPGTISNADLAEELLIHYISLPESENTVLLQINRPLSENSEEKSENREFLDFLETEPLIELAEDEDAMQLKSVGFIPLTVTEDFTATKHGRDLDHTNVEQGDRIEYSIDLNTQKPQTEVMLSDTISTAFEIQNESFTWQNCGDRVHVEMQAGNTNYPFVLTDLELNPTQTCQITYQAKVVETPEVNLWLEDKALEQYSTDGYLDIGINLANNPTGVIKYLMSNEPHSHTYTEIEVPEEEKATNQSSSFFEDENKNGIPDWSENLSADQIAEYAQKTYQNQILADEDEDGLPDSWDKIIQSGKANLPLNFKSTLKTLNSSLGSTIDYLESFQCQKIGCLNIPINYAFLTPGAISLGALGSLKERLGIQISGVYSKPFVMPIFAWGVPGYPPVWPPNPNWEGSAGRIYLSPTLTGGLGFVVCPGPYLQAYCMVTAIQMPGLQCGSIVGNLTKILPKSLNTIFSAGVGAGTTKSNLGANQNASGGYQVEFSLETFSFSPLKNINRRTVSIGSIITRWVNRQIEEVASALLDLPTIYLRYPSFDRVFESQIETEIQNKTAQGESLLGFSARQAGKISATAETQIKAGQEGIEALYNYIQSLPFITLEQKNITIKIPYLQKGQIEILSNELKTWKAEAEKEIKRFKEQFKEENWDENIRLNFDLKTNKLLQSIDQNLVILDSYANLPRLIVAYQQGLVKYLTQVTTMLKDISEMMGGWIVRNLLRYKLWKQFILTLKEILEGWRMILAVMRSYQEKCTVCRAESYTMSNSLLAIISMAIPEPPILRFPHWPDIKIDLSHINGHLQIVLPDLRIITEPIIFPKLPPLSLPDLSLDGNLQITLPSIPLLPELPPLPTLPDLPSFNLPKLPNLPPPPRIPELPGEIKSLLQVIDQILTIYCLIKKGLWLYPEYKVKTIVENLTSRPSGFMFFDFLHLQPPDFNLPGYDLAVDSYVNFEVDLDFLAAAMKQAVKPWNEIVTNLLDTVDADLDFKIKVPLPLDQEFEYNLQGPNTTELKKNLLIDPGNLSSFVPRMNRLIRNQKVILSAEEIAEALNSPQMRRIHKMQQILTDYQTDLNRQLHTLQTTRNLQTIAQDSKEPQVLLATSSNQSSMPTEESRYFASLTSAEMAQFENGLQNTSPDVFENLSEYLTSAEATLPNGAYLFNKVTGNATKLMRYAEETETIDHYNFFDADQDGDEDLVFSMGNAIYLKKNLQQTPASISNNLYPYTPQVSDFENLAEAQPAVKNYRFTLLASERARVTWDPLTDARQASGYLIQNSNYLKGYLGRNQLQNYLYLVNDTEQINVFVNGQTPALDQIINGPAEITLERGYNFSLQANESFKVSENTDENVEFVLPNGYFYSVIYGIFTDGTRTTRSQQILLAPQKEADVISPLILLPDKIQLYLGETQIFDTNLFQDDNPDVKVTILGEPQEGLEVLYDNTLQVGAFDIPQEKTFSIQATDAAGNHTEKEITLQVLPPQINLDPDSLKTNGTVSGFVTPVKKEFPFMIYRERFGQTKLLRLSSLHSDQKYHTDTQGAYSVTGLTSAAGILIKDVANQPIATLDKSQSQFSIEQSDYSQKILPASDVAPTRLVLLDPAQKIVANIWPVFDSNSDVHLVTKTQAPFAETSTEPLPGVYVTDHDLSDHFQFSSLPGNAPDYPGGVTIFDTQNEQTLFLIGADGTLEILDQNYTLELQKSSNANQIQIVLRAAEGSLLGEIIFLTDPTAPLEILATQRWGSPSATTVQSTTTQTTTTSVDLCPDIPGMNQGCPTSLLAPHYSTDQKAGIYITAGDSEECSFLDYSADLQPGDKIFTAISDPSNQTIWSKSNMVEY